MAPLKLKGGSREKDPRPVGRPAPLWKEGDNRSASGRKRAFAAIAIGVGFFVFFGIHELFVNPEQQAARPTAQPPSFNTQARTNSPDQRRPTVQMKIGLDREHGQLIEVLRRAMNAAPLSNKGGTPHPLQTLPPRRPNIARAEAEESSAGPASTAARSVRPAATLSPSPNPTSPDRGDTQVASLPPTLSRVKQEAASPGAVTTLPATTAATRAVQPTVAVTALLLEEDPVTRAPQQPGDCQCCSRCQTCSRCIREAMPTVEPPSKGGVYIPTRCAPNGPRGFRLATNASAGSPMPTEQVSTCDCGPRGFVHPAAHGCDRMNYRDLLNTCVDRSLPLVNDTNLYTLNSGGTLVCYSDNDMVCRVAGKSGGWETAIQLTIEFAMHQLLLDRIYATTGKSLTARETGRELLEAAQRDVVFVDIGSNVGVFALNQWTNGFDVIAIDAFPTNVQLLRMSACVSRYERAHGLAEYPSSRSSTRQDNSIQVIHAALGSVEHERCLMVSQARNFGDIHIICNETLLEAAEHGNASFALPGGYVGRGSVTMRRLDNIVRDWNHQADGTEGNLGYKDYIVKLDVEGNEGDVLFGAAEWLSQPFRPKLVIAETWRSRNLTALAEFMLRRGYKVWVGERRAWISSVASFALHARNASLEVDTAVFVDWNSTHLFDQGRNTPEWMPPSGSRRVVPPERHPEDEEVETASSLAVRSTHSAGPQQPQSKRPCRTTVAPISGDDEAPQPPTGEPSMQPDGVPAGAETLTTSRSPGQNTLLLPRRGVGGTTRHSNVRTGDVLAPLGTRPVDPDGAESEPPASSSLGARDSQMESLAHPGSQKPLLVSTSQEAQPSVRQTSALSMATRVSARTGGSSSSRGSSAHLDDPAI